MKPVTQSRTGFPSGNCTEASIASILEIPLDAVPDLYAIDPNRKEGLSDLDAWLAGLGMVIVFANVHPLPYPLDVKGTMKNIGIEWLYRLPWNGFHLLCGPNRHSGVEHMTVAEDGIMVWDPHPARPGLASVSGFGIIVNIEDVPEQYRNGKWIHVYDVIHGAVPMEVANG